MNPEPQRHRAAKRVLKRIPKVGKYVQRKEHLEGEVAALQNALDQQVKRNDQWEEEVRTLRGEYATFEIIWPVDPQDILKADPSKPYKAKKSNKRPPFTINWVVPPMGPVSGGHADIFRVIHYLESRGHTCRVYFYDTLKQATLAELKQRMGQYDSVEGEVFHNAAEMKPCDAIFATNWYTAYPVVNFVGAAKKFYFVQDFEPYFDPVGSYSTLAENTYRFGLHGITLGSWLKQKLEADYKMDCDAIELGVDTKQYNLLPKKTARNAVMFYARPVTPRRGFELGMLALQAFQAQNPDIEIHLVGWDLGQYKLPESYISHGILSPKKLNQLYNRCRAGLVLSFTNMSLLPLEMAAAGCVPIVNDAPHTRMASYSQLLKYAEPTPGAIAAALTNAVNQQNEADALKLAQAAKKYSWDDSNKKVEQVLVRELAK